MTQLEDEIAQINADIHAMYQAHDHNVVNSERELEENIKPLAAQRDELSGELFAILWGLRIGDKLRALKPHRPLTPIPLYDAGDEGIVLEVSVVNRSAMVEWPRIVFEIDVIELKETCAIIRSE